jgi:hypothetical protein
MAGEEAPAERARANAMLHDEFERAQRIANGQVESSDLAWLSKGFHAFLASGGALSLERCLRLPRNDGELRRAARDYWLRRAWRLLGADLSPWQRSEELAAALNTFESGLWRQWRSLAETPVRATEIEAAMFNAFRAHNRIPTTAMQLHNIARHRRHS